MRILTTSAVLAAMLAGPLQAESVASTDPAMMAETLKSLGQSASLVEDANGDPLIEAEGDNGPYQIWFYGCNGGNGCTSVNFSVGFDLANGSTLELVNDWNSTRLVGRAYLDDEQDPFLDHYVTLGGGVTLLTFAQFVGEWDRALGEFREMINF